jgi:hypothetical protein
MKNRKGNFYFMQVLGLKVAARKVCNLSLTLDGLCTALAVLLHSII